MIEAVVTSGAIRRAKLQSNCHHQQTNTQVFHFSQAECPSCHPTNSVRALYNIKLFIERKIRYQRLITKNNLHLQTW